MSLVGYSHQDVQTSGPRPRCQLGHTVQNENKWNNFQCTVRAFSTGLIPFLPWHFADNCHSGDEGKYLIGIHVMRKDAISGAVQGRMRVESRI